MAPAAVADVLRPIAGRRLVRELRPKHVGRLAAQFPAGVHDPRFAGLLQRIDTGQFHNDNAVRVFFRGTETFDAMIAAAIDAARERSPGRVLHLQGRRDGPLSSWRRSGARVGRGVKVRVLADAFGSIATRPASGRRCAPAESRSGSSIRSFRTSAAAVPRPPQDPRRRRQVGFTGGMNIGDEYGSSRSAARPGPWRDTHVRVEGPAAWGMAIVFYRGLARGRRQPDRARAARRRRPAASRSSCSTRVPVAATAKSPRRSPPSRRPRAGGSGSPTPTSRPGGAPSSVLGEAAGRGVDVRFLLPGRSDVPLVRHAGHGYYAALLDRGVRIFEYQPAVLHAKTLVADDFVSLAGSSNLDFRSFHFNAECNLVMLDDAIGATLARAFERDVRHADEVDLETWRRRPLLHRIGDEIAERLSPVL